LYIYSDNKDLEAFIEEILEKENDYSETELFEERTLISTDGNSGYSFSFMQLGFLK
jgi:hypothetical protein